MSKPRPRILIVDDERRVTDPLRILLEHTGYNVRVANGGREALQAVSEELPDLVLLDIAMPDLDGFAVLERVRELSDVPVIMLTARTQSEYKVRSYDLDADDFINKPFHNEELLALIRRRLRKANGSISPKQRIIIDEHLTVDQGAHTVIVDGKEVHLTRVEWRIFSALREAQGRVVTFEELLRAGWQDPLRGREHVKVQIQHIRKKIGDDAKHTRYIHTHREIGYGFEPRRR